MRDEKQNAANLLNFLPIVSFLERTFIHLLEETFFGFFGFFDFWYFSTAIYITDKAEAVGDLVTLLYSVKNLNNLMFD